MSLNILECQKCGVVTMLNLSSPSMLTDVDFMRGPNQREITGSGGDLRAVGGSAWKVLVYDAFCQDLLATLMKVGSLRQHGVTLHLRIDAARSPVPEAPAVYLMRPTRWNIERLISDVQRSLYLTYYVNFALPVARTDLEYMAKCLVEVSGTQRITQVFDRYIGFVSLSPTEVSLNLPQTYSMLHSSQSSDSQIEDFLECVVEGILSSLVSLSMVPTIHCTALPASPSHLIARKLTDRIRAALADAGHSFASGGPHGRGGNIFSMGAPHGRGSATGRGVMTQQRPSLIILDREIDFAVMLRHNWSYQCMVHDVLDLKLNRVSIPTGEGGVDKKVRTYDLDSSDQFWSAHSSSPFTEAAIAVSDALSEFSRKVNELNAPSEGGRGQKTVGETDIASSLATAMSALPEMTERKRSIDMHTNIATALVDEIKARSLDKCSEVEGLYDTATLPTSIQHIRNDILTSNATVADKTRALVCLYLAKPSMSQQNISEIREMLVEAGGNTNTRPLHYLLHLESLRSMTKELVEAHLESSTNGGGPPSTYTAGWGDFGSKVIHRGRGLLQGVKNLLPASRELAITKIAEPILERKSTPVTDKFLFFDPKAPAGHDTSATAARDRPPSRTGIIYVVGGGNFAEAQAVKELAKKSQKQILYGATNFCSPVEFLIELSNLGESGS